VEVLLEPNDQSATHTTFSSKMEVEHHILARKKRHSQQAILMPFASDPILPSSITPCNASFVPSEFLEGAFTEFPPLHNYSEVKLTFYGPMLKRKR
jgi:hypothetical protein